LTLTGSATINGTGNALDNVLTGNSAVNTLTGLAGNDTYVVQNTTDVVTEAASAGTDLVQSSATYTLASNVENLTLTGTSAINGTGQALDNVLTGNTSVNTLTGLGGNDTLEGKAGNDSLVGGDGADLYRFSAGDGSDTISNVSADAAIDRLVFSNVTRVELTFARTGNDLLITRTAAPTDSVRVTNWFTATGNRIDFVDTSGGQSTTADQIDALISSGGGSFSNSSSPPQLEFAAEPSRIVGSLDELMEAAVTKSRPLFTECGLEYRIQSANASNHEIATPGGLGAPSGSSSRLVLQLERFIHAIAGFKKHDGFDAMSSTPIGDDLSQAVQRMTVSPVRDLRGNSHME
jgi:hypothetical protein